MKPAAVFAHSNFSNQSGSPFDQYRSEEVSAVRIAGEVASKTPASSRLKFLISVFLGSITGYASLAPAAESVVQVSNSAGHTVWKITEPNVKKATEDFPQIVFSPGQTVTVTAVGCVQTGGIGHTWKRYVDPAGKESDKLYHGEIFVPGANAGLEFFDPRTPMVFTIPASASLPAGQNHLKLGYTDDHDGYGDNGYHDRNSDNGNFNQCWDLGNATIIIEIAPLVPVAPPPQSTTYVLTLENVMIRNMRSHHSDTDVLAASATVDGTQAAVATQKIGDVEKGSHPVKFPIQIDEVQPNDRINFVYTITNAGNPQAGKIDDAIVKGVQTIGGPIPVVGAVLAAVATVWGAAFNLFDPDCDGPVVADSIMGTGADLAAWTQNGPQRRTMSFPGVDSADGCGKNSFYEVTYSIERIAPSTIVRPYMLRFNARSKQALVGDKARLLQFHKPAP